MLPNVTGEFRVAMDPELRFTPSGMAICKIRAVASSRKKEGDEWVDDKTCWVSLTGFKKLAENMAESFLKGDLLTVNGRLQTEDWEDKDGNKRTSVEIVVFHLGHSVAFNPSRSIKSDRPASSNSGGGGSAPAGEDPWGTPPGGSDEPPF